MQNQRYCKDLGWGVTTHLPPWGPWRHNHQQDVRYTRLLVLTSIIYNIRADIWDRRRPYLHMRDPYRRQPNLQFLLTCSLTPPIVCTILQRGHSRLLGRASFLLLPQGRTLLHKLYSKGTVRDTSPVHLWYLCGALEGPSGMCSHRPLWTRTSTRMGRWG